MIDFEEVLNENNLRLNPLSVRTLQVNITKLCNQACRHCHVDASPKRTEKMSSEGIDACLSLLRREPSIEVLDITGGAPELHPEFDRFVCEARTLHKSVIVRHNLTVTFDGNPQTGEEKKYLPKFFAEQGVEVVSSLPYFQEYYTDKQRGRGVFEKSIQGIRLLNEQGYGRDPNLRLHLVYNPVGTFLPGPQASLEKQYKTELQDRFGLVFNSLFTITNMPIHRFQRQLEHLGQYEEYMEKLLGAFNPAAAEGVMCRSLISVSHDGKLYDCDFNQMLDLPIRAALDENSRPMNIFTLEIGALMKRQIAFDRHCFGCTAGAGSSCGGATVSFSAPSQPFDGPVEGSVGGPVGGPTDVVGRGDENR